MGDSREGEQHFALHQMFMIREYKEENRRDLIPFFCHIAIKNI